ncbi:MAG: hypothetical protein R2755_08145 [Acidimicrobiales bacterium]
MRAAISVDDDVLAWWSAHSDPIGFYAVAVCASERYPAAIAVDVLRALAGQPWTLAAHEVITGNDQLRQWLARYEHERATASFRRVRWLSREHREDLAQDHAESVWRLLQRPGALDGINDPQRYFSRMRRNTLADHVRRTARRRRHEDEWPFDSASAAAQEQPEDRIVHLDKVRALRSLLDQEARDYLADAIENTLAGRDDRNTVRSQRRQPHVRRTMRIRARVLRSLRTVGLLPPAQLPALPPAPPAAEPDPTGGA